MDKEKIKQDLVDLKEKIAEIWERLEEKFFENDIPKGELCEFWDGPIKPEYPHIAPYHSFDKISHKSFFFRMQYIGDREGYKDCQGKGYEHAEPLKRPKDLGLWVAVDGTEKKRVVFSDCKFNFYVDGSICKVAGFNYYEISRSEIACLIKLLVKPLGQLQLYGDKA